MENAKSPAPFFILGAPRSGTTLVQLILDSHSEIAVCPESYLFGILDRTHSYVTIQKEWQYFEILRTLEQWLTGFNDPALNLVREQNNAGSPYTGPTRAFLEHLRDSYLSRKNKRLFGEKTPEHIHFLTGIKTVCPQAKIIFVVRNPLSVVNSLVKGQRANAFFTNYSREALVRRSALIVRQAWQDRKAFLHHSSENTYTIQYERLTTQPQKEIHLVCEFLGVPFEENMLDYHKREQSFIVDHSSSKGRIHTKLDQAIQQNSPSLAELELSAQEQFWLKQFLRPSLNASPFEDLQSVESAGWSWWSCQQFILALIHYKLKTFRWREWVLKARNYIRLKVLR